VSILIPSAIRIGLPTICTDTTARAGSLTAAMSPNPTVENTVGQK